MNGSDGGHKSQGPGPIYTSAGHPLPFHTSFHRAHSLSSVPLRELRDLWWATARNSSTLATSLFLPQAGFVLFVSRDSGRHFRHSSRYHGSRDISPSCDIWSCWELSKVVGYRIRYSRNFGRQLGSLQSGRGNLVLFGVRRADSGQGDLEMASGSWRCCAGSFKKGDCGAKISHGSGPQPSAILLPEEHASALQVIATPYCSK
jgi:hypothetical protein